MSNQDSQFGYLEEGEMFGVEFVLSLRAFQRQELQQLFNIFFIAEEFMNRFLFVRKLVQCPVYGWLVFGVHLHWPWEGQRVELLAFR